MPIAALSKDASDSITSTLVLNDAISVIKELIDNALDAHATNIIIEISANTLDIIQVKDNGAGIGVEDRQLLCRRGYTSKIRTLEDLAQIGGTFLGFRGEALASVAGLSESLTFITRVDGEIVGTRLEFDSNCKLISSSSASHGTGTTVRVTSFLRSIPVRRQTAQKQAAKTLSSIKSLLFDYAFARPTVRFQCKVLKSKSDFKDNWSYAPCVDAHNLALVAAKIVGKDVVAQCIQEKATSDNGLYVIDGLLPSKDADILKVSKSDQYVSIDGRPLIADRGFMKDVNKIYRLYLRNSFSESGSLSKKIFLLLRLQCPSGAYDVNIEPAKNEVLFEDPKLVLELFEDLCKRIYGNANPPKSTHRVDRIDQTQSESQSFNVLLARKKPDNREDNLQNLQVDETSPLTTGVSKAIRTNSYSVYQDASPPARVKSPNTNVYNEVSNVTNEDHVGKGSNIARLDTVGDDDEGSEHEDIMDYHITNPFVLAKMNTRIRPSKVATTNFVRSQNGSQSPEEDEQVLLGLGSGVTVSSPSVTTKNPLPSPGVSPERHEPFQNPGPPNRPWKKSGRKEVEAAESSVPSNSLTTITPTARATLIDSWTKSINCLSPIQRTLQSGVPSSQLSDISDSTLTVALQSPLTAKTLNSQAGSVRDTRHKPFRSPIKKTVEKQNTTLLEKMTLNPLLPPGSKLQNLPASASSEMPTKVNLLPDFGQPDAESLAELDDIMDFEHRKRDSIMQHRNRKTKATESPNTSAVQQEHLPPTASKIFASNKEHILEGIGNEDAYASRFARSEGTSEDDLIPPQPKSASYTQNPHRNRYLKAIRDLDASSASKGLKAAESGLDDNTVENHTKGYLGEVRGNQECPETRNVFPAKDPRAFLILQQKNNEREGNNGKSKRYKLSKLPFETISPDIATYQLRHVVPDVDAIDVGLLEKAANVLRFSDPYILSGSIDIALSGQNVDSDTLVLWDSKVRQMLKQQSISWPPETG